MVVLLTLLLCVVAYFALMGLLFLFVALFIFPGPGSSPGPDVFEPSELEVRFETAQAVVESVPAGALDREFMLERFGWPANIRGLTHWDHVFALGSKPWSLSSKYRYLCVEYDHDGYAVLIEIVDQ